MDLHAQISPAVTPTLVTDRLTLRPLHDSDAGAITAGLSDWNVMRWLSAPPWPYTAADSATFIRDIAPTGTNWAIDAGAGLIGVIGVKPDLGYWLSADVHGHGYMSEAATAAIHWYFDQHETPLVSGHFLGNAPSRAVLLKLGFRDTYVETAFATPLNHDVQLQRMVLTKADWMAQGAALQRLRSRAQ